MMNRRLLALLLMSCGPFERAPTGSNPVHVEPSPQVAAEEESEQSACTLSAGRAAAQASLRGPVARATLFESDGRSLLAVLMGEEFASELNLLLVMGECVDDDWQLAPPLPIGVLPRESGGAPDAYDDADVEMVIVDLSFGTRGVQIEWRRWADFGIDRRGVRWVAYRDGPVDLGECTTRDLRSIDSSPFLQGHELSRWRVVAGSPPRLTGMRIAGGGHARDGVMVWSDRTDERILDVPLVEVTPELSELCL